VSILFFFLAVIDDFRHVARVHPMKKEPFIIRIAVKIDFEGTFI
jgi:hypothetical protein